MSMTIEQNNSTQYQSKKNKTAAAGGIAAGLAFYSAVNILPQAVFVDKMVSQMSKIASSADTDVIRSALDKAMGKTGLFMQKGVQIMDLTGYVRPSRKSYIAEIVENQFSMPKAILKAKNAAFDYSKNQIFINIEKMGTAGFHEIGHAINFNQSKFWKILQKCRLPLMVLSGIPVVISLFTHKKAEGEEPKNGFDKTGTFVKDNAGKLAALALVPIIAEEMKATQRGNKLAKELLSPELYKKVVKTNKFGLVGYLAAPVFVGIAAWLAGKIKDSIAKPNSDKNQTAY